MLAFIARAICSKTSPALRRRRTSAAIALYLATEGTVGLCRLLSSIRAGGRLAARCTARALLTASVLMPKAVATASQLLPALIICTICGSIASHFSFFLSRITISFCCGCDCVIACSQGLFDVVQRSPFRNTSDVQGAMLMRIRNGNYDDNADLAQFKSATCYDTVSVNQPFVNEWVAFGGN